MCICPAAESVSAESRREGSDETAAVSQERSLARMNCYVTVGENQETRDGSSILKNRYFNSEADFCRVYSEEVLLHLERMFLWNQISYFIRDDHSNVFSRLFSTKKHCWIIRLNSHDLEYAAWLVEDMRGVEIIAQIPERDWVPSEAKKEREQYGGSREYFGRYRAR